MGMRDLKELHPDIADNLNKLMDMSAEEVEGLGLVFQVGEGEEGGAGSAERGATNEGRGKRRV